MTREELTMKLGANKYKGISIFSKRFDCDWKNKFEKHYVNNGCEKCKVCKYLNFLDWATGCAPPGSTIQYEPFIDKYVQIRFEEATKNG